MAGLDDFPDLNRTIDDHIDDAESLPFRYTNKRGSVSQVCHSYPKKPETLVEREQQMELYEIGILMVLWMLSNCLFYSMGIKTGYVDGRKAVREYYENRQKVRV